MSALAPWLALAALAAVAAPAPNPDAGSAPAPAPLADRLGWNARERTASGLEELHAERAARAQEAFDRAHTLRPDAPVTAYNAGTVRIGADDRAAASLLAPAAKSAPGALAPDAWYNLGNARLGSHDAKGAVAAYVEALKRRPSWGDAKYNLEIALRDLERQQQQQKQQNDKQREPDRQNQQNQQDQQGSRKQQPQGPSGKQGPASQNGPGAPGGEGGQDRGAQPTPSDSGRTGTTGSQDQAAAPNDGTQRADAQPKPGDGAPGSRGDQGGTRNAPTGAGGPQSDPSRRGMHANPNSQFKFHDLPDMSAKQAAAILREVENLERSQRRQRAEQKLLKQVQEGKDW